MQKFLAAMKELMPLPNSAEDAAKNPTGKAPNEDSGIGCKR